MATKVTIQNGQFQDAAGNLVTGTLQLQLSQDAIVTGTGTVVPGTPIQITVTAGNAAATQIWGTDNLTPSGLVYIANVFDSSGSRVFGPENWSITGAGPIELNTLVPSSAAVSYPSAIVTSPSADQTITANNLLPAAGNTSQSLGSSAAPWNAVLGTETVGKWNNVFVVDGVKYTTIQAAVTAAGASGEVYLPAGTYSVTSQISLPHAIKFRGAGVGATTITPTNALAAALFSLSGTGYGYAFSDLSIDMSSASAQDAISLNVAAAHPLFRNLRIVYAAAGTGKAFNFGSSNGGTLHLTDITIVNPGYGIYIQADLAQENFFNNISIDSASTVGIDIERTTASDTGGAYFSNVRVTNSAASTTGISWKVNSTTANTEQPVFFVNCVGDGTLGGGHTAQFINVADIRLTGGWFTNGASAGSNLSAVYLSGCTDVSFNHCRISSNSRDLTIAGNATRIQFSNVTFAGSSTNLYANGATLSSVRFIGSTFQGTVASAADIALLAGGASSVIPILSTTGGQVWTNSSGTATCLDVFDATNGASTPHKYLRTASGNLQVINSGFSAAILSLSDAGNLTVAGAQTIQGATPTGSGTDLGLGNTTGFGNGAASTAVTTTLKGTGSGPATPQTIVKYLEIDIGGVKYWMPLVQ